MELMLKLALLPHTPISPFNLSTPQLRGQIEQEANGVNNNLTRESGNSNFTSNGYACKDN